MKEKFNKYCADVMGIAIATTSHPDDGGKLFLNINARVEYNPYDDLNRMAEVVEKLVKNKPNLPIRDALTGYEILNGMTVKQLLRDFVTATDLMANT